MWERTPADKTYLIVAGEVAIRRNNVAVARLGPGDVVGEMAVVNQQLRTATVVAATPPEVLHFTAEAVTELFDWIPPLPDVPRPTAHERPRPPRSAPPPPTAPTP